MSSSKFGNYIGAPRVLDAAGLGASGNTYNLSRKDIGGVHYLHHSIEYAAADDSAGYTGIVNIAGQTEFTSFGNYTWTAPAGVTSVCVVAIGGGGAGAASTLASNGVSGGGGGGGGLHWRNNISVTPGTTYYVTVGAGGVNSTGAGSNTHTSGGDSYFRSGSFTGTILVRAGGGARGSYNSAFTTVQGGLTYYLTYGGGGGQGGLGGGGSNGNSAGGGGGAGGYSGQGGQGNNGTTYNQSDGAGGGGGGGSGANGYTAVVNWGGGGTNIYGQGINGVKAGTNFAQSAAAGQGYQGSPVGGAIRSGSYGGGGSGAEDDSPSAGAVGIGGAVRIIWGTGRAFPSTLTADQ